MNTPAIRKKKRFFFAFIVSASVIVTSIINIPEHVTASHSPNPLFATPIPAAFNAANVFTSAANVSTSASQLNSPGRVPTNVSEATISLLLNDTISALKAGDKDTALTHLKLVSQELSATVGNTTSMQILRLLIGDSIQSIQNGDINKALTHLNLVALQLAGYRSNNTLVRQQSSVAKVQTNVSNFSTYKNPILGLMMEYPRDWLIQEHTFNPAANNTIVSFLSPSKSASALGNISGVSGNFVPYVDIFVFPSKNILLPRLVGAVIKRFDLANMTVIPSESKPIILNGGVQAYALVYMVTIAGDESFKKMQIWTVYAGNVYVITYTAQAAIFSNYLPIAQKMVHSFAFVPVVNSSKLTPTGHTSSMKLSLLHPATPARSIPPLTK